VFVTGNRRVFAGTWEMKGVKNERWVVSDRRAFLHALAGDQLMSIDGELADAPREVWRAARLRHTADVVQLLAERVRALSPLSGADGELIVQLERRDSNRPRAGWWFSALYRP